MTDRMFRYYRDDFGKIPVRVIHMDLIFDVFDDHTTVTSDLHAESRDETLSEIALNAKNLEIIAVSCSGHACSYDYDTKKSMLVIRFLEPVAPLTRFTLHTETICRPTKNILEGLYYDETPPGTAPSRSPSASSGGSSGWSRVSMT